MKWTLRPVGMIEKCECLLDGDKVSGTGVRHFVVYEREMGTEAIRNKWDLWVYLSRVHTCRPVDGTRGGDHRRRHSTVDTCQR